MSVDYLSQDPDLQIISKNNEDLFLDFEAELNRILGSGRSDSLSSSSSASLVSMQDGGEDISMGVRRPSVHGEPNQVVYERDGTILCSNISHQTLVRITCPSSLVYITWKSLQC